MGKPALPLLGMHGPLLEGIQMYQFKEDFNGNQHFWFDKKLIENMNWAMLPKASKAVFPVIACHCNSKGLSFPGERTIAIMAGRSDKVVREGIRGLVGFPGFKIGFFTTRRGRKAKRFHLKMPPKEKGRSFPFHKQIIEGGNWSQLKPSAAALYPVMRYYGYFDELTYDVTVFENYTFTERTHDFCEAETLLMAKYAGITRNSIHQALANLQDCCLIEPVDRGNGREWKVFLRPPKYYKRDYLNEKTMGKLSEMKGIVSKTTGHGCQKLPNHAQKITVGCPKNYRLSM